MKEVNRTSHQQARIDFVRGLQQETYTELMSKLLESASLHYLSLCHVFHFEPKLRMDRCVDLNVDHDVLKSIYLCMADSFFVFCAREVCAEPAFIARKTEDSLDAAWKHWFSLEAHRLTRIPSFVERLMEILAANNPGTATRDEADLLKFVQKEYPSID